MKKLLIGSMVAVLCIGASVVYAEDAHHQEQGSAPVPNPAAGKSMNAAGGNGVSGAQMDKAQERMKQAQALMSKMRGTTDPAERRKFMQEHTQAMRDIMGMMREMRMGMMGGGRGMGMMNGGRGMGMMNGGREMGRMGQGKRTAQTDSMMSMHLMMEERMEMMQMMMEQMFERQEMLMQGGK